MLLRSVVAQKCYLLENRRMSDCQNIGTCSCVRIQEHVRQLENRYMFECQNTGTCSIVRKQIHVRQLEKRYMFDGQKRRWLEMLFVRMFVSQKCRLLETLFLNLVTPRHALVTLSSRIFFEKNIDFFVTRIGQYKRDESVTSHNEGHVLSYSRDEKINIFFQKKQRDESMTRA